MEQRICNWKTNCMKPVIPGTYLMLGWKPPVVKDDEIVAGIECILFIVTRVNDDGWVYGIRSIDDKK